MVAQSSSHLSPPKKKARSKPANGVKVIRPKRYPCPNASCSALFDRPCSVRQHVLTHTGEKPHACPCGTAFAARNNLYRHQRKCKALAQMVASDSLVNGILPSGPRATSPNHRSPSPDDPHNPRIDPSSSPHHFYPHHGSDALDRSVPAAGSRSNEDSLGLYKGSGASRGAIINGYTGATPASYPSTSSHGYANGHDDATPFQAPINPPSPSPHSSQFHSLSSYPPTSRHGHFPPLPPPPSYPKAYGIGNGFGPMSTSSRPSLRPLQTSAPIAHNANGYHHGRNNGVGGGPLSNGASGGAPTSSISPSPRPIHSAHAAVTSSGASGSIGTGPGGSSTSSFASPSHNEYASTAGNSSYNTRTSEPLGAGPFTGSASGSSSGPAVEPGTHAPPSAANGGNGGVSGASLAMGAGRVPASHSQYEGNVDGRPSNGLAQSYGNRAGSGGDVTHQNLVNLATIATAAFYPPSSPSPPPEGSTSTTRSAAHQSSGNLYGSASGWHHDQQRHAGSFYSSSPPSAVTPTTAPVSTTSHGYPYMNHSNAIGYGHHHGPSYPHHSSSTSSSTTHASSTAASMTPSPLPGSITKVSPPSSNGSPPFLPAPPNTSLSHANKSSGVSEEKTHTLPSFSPSTTVDVNSHGGTGGVGNRDLPRIRTSEYPPSAHTKLPPLYSAASSQLHYNDDSYRSRDNQPTSRGSGYQSSSTGYSAGGTTENHMHYSRPSPFTQIPISAVSPSPSSEPSPAPASRYTGTSAYGSGNVAGHGVGHEDRFSSTAQDRWHNGHQDSLSSYGSVPSGPAGYSSHTPSHHQQRYEVPPPPRGMQPDSISPTYQHANGASGSHQSHNHYVTAGGRADYQTSSEWRHGERRGGQDNGVPYESGTTWKSSSHAGSGYPSRSTGSFDGDAGANGYGGNSSTGWSLERRNAQVGAPIGISSESGGPTYGHGAPANH